LNAAWVAGEYRKVLELLQHHPYVLALGDLAFIRAAMCEELGDWRAAALFYAVAIRHFPNDLDTLLATTAKPLELLHQDRLQEAREYVRYQTELFPHPVTWLTSGIVAFQHATSDPTSVAAESFKENFSRLEKARGACQQLPDAQRKHPHLLRLIVFSFAAEAVLAIRLRDRNRAKEVLEKIGQLRLAAPASELERGSAVSIQRTTDHLRRFLETEKPDRGLREGLDDLPTVKNLFDFGTRLPPGGREMTIRRKFQPMNA
jgi:tetratricopeptide (TPR) repeat protein